MNAKLPQPTLILIDRLQRAARYLDELAANCVDDGAHAIAKSHAETAWHAAGRLEDLATVLEELIPYDARMRAATGRES
jgi:hypothetical protein